MRHPLQTDNWHKQNNTYLEQEQRTKCDIPLGLVGARTTTLQLAVLALKDEPVGTGMAHGASPLDECRLGLDQVE